MPLDPDLARTRLEEARIYVLLTRQLCRLDPLLVLEECLDAGADLVQVRELQLPDRELLEWVHDVRERCAKHRVPVIVNDRADIALLAGADGVHVGQTDLPPRAVRELFGKDLLVGLSIHGHHQIRESADEPVDYIGIGPVFDTETKGVEGHGAAWLKELLPEATLPAFGVGGIDLETVDDAVAAGLDRIAVSSAICGAESPRSVIDALREALA
ncbi:MAG: thiamine phosphate synthase [Planctomycetes bacterium]|nr:thiamine phosphate synthase [Planctomycetota bacterium]